MSLIDGIYWQNVYDADKPKEKIPETNYQRVMRKTPEELAEWIADIMPISCPPGCSPAPLGCDDVCDECWLDWLRQEVEE